jgi:putative two-component system response regulator
MKTIFVIDDNNINLIMANEVLSGEYKVITMASASILFDFLENLIPDLILLDIMMPEIDGFDALKKLKSSPRYAEIPVMFLTSKKDDRTESLGFEMGVIDFISKPFSKSILLKRIKTHLRIEDIIRERTNSLTRLKNSIVSVLANMVEKRDTITGGHVERTTQYIKLLLDAMMARGVYVDEISGWEYDLAVSSVRLHDIGKIVITDAILNKPDKLTDEEFEIIKTHAIEGEKIIDSIIEESGDEVFLHYAKLFAGYHHEKWDGTGYPRGLKGEDIPLQGRIMAIADVYDALVSKRPYKKAFKHEEAVGIIKNGRGTQFDPLIIDIFLEIEKLFKETAACQ